VRAPWRAGSILVACLATITALTGPADATRTSASYGLSPTLKLTTLRVTKGPQEVRILKLAQGAVPDISLGGQRFPLQMKTSAMSAAAGALAGVNGDFGTDADQPVHTLMVDGELWTSGLLKGNALAWSNDGDTAYIGSPDLHVKAVEGRTRLFRIDSWNALQDSTTVSAYTSRGGTLARPPGLASPSAGDPSWCAARLEPKNKPSWHGSKQTSIFRRYQVVEQPEPCPQTPMSIGTTPGEVVLVAEHANGGGTNPVMAMTPGDQLRIFWKLKGWPHTTDVMGGAQILVDAGKNVAPGYHSGADHILDYNPRTAVGISAGCSDADLATSCAFRLVTVDGRQLTTNWSRGVRLPFVANELIHLGSWEGLNLDGGGSTTMWVRDTNPAYCQLFPAVGGCVVQRPASSASGGERSIRSAIVVLPGADPGTPRGLQ
jgi:hypothetical protein